MGFYARPFQGFSGLRGRTRIWEEDEAALAKAVGLRHQLGHAVFGVNAVDPKGLLQLRVNGFAHGLHASALHAARFHDERRFQEGVF